MLRTMGRMMSLALVLMAFVLAIPACQSGGRARPQMLTGDDQVPHERHATGIDSHSPD